jgi:hypothetical protein
LRSVIANGEYPLSGNSMLGDIFPHRCVHEEENIKTNDDPYGDPDPERSALFGCVGLKD